MTYAEDINIIASFLGRRNLLSLRQEELEQKYRMQQADVFVLFGGSILNGADVFAKANENRIAKHYIIVGGHGHTTDVLRQKVKEEYPEISVSEQSEAEIFNVYLQKKYNVQADLLECRSTNCGNNITNLLELLEQNHMDVSSLILCQDASMQLRMTAGMKKYRPELTVINYAAYHAVVKEENGILKYEKEIHGMWNMNQYLTLLMGEIPRLTDDENGYGPLGKGYIAHVDIPESVRTAFDHLSVRFADHIRTADSAYATVIQNRNR